MNEVLIRRAEPADAEWIGCFLHEWWRATTTPCLPALV